MSRGWVGLTLKGVVVPAPLPEWEVPYLAFTLAFEAQFHEEHDLVDNDADRHARANRDESPGICPPSRTRP